jgi:hypothetical protein
LLALRPRQRATAGSGAAGEKLPPAEIFCYYLYIDSLLGEKAQGGDFYFWQSNRFADLLPK